MYVRKNEIRPVRLVGASSLYLVAFGNWRFFSNLNQFYPLPQSLGFLFSLGLGLWLATFFVLNLLFLHRALKPALAIAFFLAAPVAYFSDVYGIAMDEAMIQNVLRTDFREASDLWNLKLLFYFFGLAVLPCTFLYFSKIQKLSWRAACLDRVKWGAIALLLFFGQIALSSQFYASFFREHKEARVYANPLYLFYSAIKYSGRAFDGPLLALLPLGRDSFIPASDTGRDLVILVLGETARSDHFSLNGYERETNPELKKADVVSFRDVTSCGTSTAASVPCLFSAFGRSEYTDKKGRQSENLLDVLSNTKDVAVLWRDNNSDSKGVALREKTEDYTSAALNSICDVECRDEGMLVGLQDFINGHPTGDILIVLHQMGNHGPAYYKRYPVGFDTFRPACASNQLEKCSRQEITNAYDNAIFYTDYFLGKVIGLLKKNQQQFHATMLYVSDHGESLGERGIYLHGMPYLIAPEAQKKVPLIFWFGAVKKAQLNYSLLLARAEQPASHDNIFHTVLGLFEVETKVYRAELDLLRAR